MSILFKRLNVLFSLFFISICLFSCKKKSEIYVNQYIKYNEINNYEIFDKCKDSVVKVTSYDNDNNIITYATGVVITNKYILTNFHPVKNSKKFIIDTYSNNKFEATLGIYDKEEDLAILVPNNKYNLDFLKEVEFSFITPAIGAKCISMGYPIKELYMSQGIIGAINPLTRDKNGNVIRGGICHNAFTSFGSSGGALFDNNGKLIGVNYSILGETSIISYSYPASELYRNTTSMLNDLKNSKLVAEKASIDIDMANLYNFKNYYTSPPNTGVAVCNVHFNGNCEGILETSDNELNIQGRKIFTKGDIIISIDNYKINTIDDI